MVRNYPETVIEVLDNDVAFSDEVLCVVRIFAASKPWSGSIRSRKRKFSDINRMLAQPCGIATPSLTFGRLDGKSSGASHYLPRDHQIVLMGKLSVVTFLHEFGHAQGLDEQEACKWSINLFRKCFPRQYSRLIHIGHTLVRPEAVAQRVNCRTGARATRKPVTRQG